MARATRWRRWLRVPDDAGVEPLHDDELVVDVRLVQHLLRRSLPRLAGLPVRPLGSTGSSNALFRLGRELVVRMPRQSGGSATIDKEARWLPTVAGRVSVAVPEVVAVGEPGFGYPERWSVSRWIDGGHPDVPWEGSRGCSSQDLARQLGRFIGELRRVPVPAEAVSDPALRWYRGGRLADVDDVFRAAVAWCADAAGLPGLDLGVDLDLDRAQRVWDAAVAVERHLPEPAATWLHGDLLAENLLLAGDGLAAVLDFGGLAVGDPTVDLVVGWEVLDEPGRAALRAALEVDDASWTRAAGWALLIALNTFPYYGRTMPARCAARRHMARAVIGSGVAR